MAEELDKFEVAWEQWRKNNQGIEAGAMDHALPEAMALLELAKAAAEETFGSPVAPEVVLGVCAVIERRWKVWVNIALEVEADRKAGKFAKR